MKKKFICTVCGYIHEGTEAPEQCPICKAPASKFKVMEDAASGDLTFATVHVLGQAYKDPVDEEVIKGLKDHFNGECGEVGMYLAMARQADREGYPEIAEAYKRYAYEEADHASRFAELLGEVLGDTKSNLEARIAAEKGACEDKFRIAKLAKDPMLSMILYMRWPRTKHAIVQALPDCTNAILENKNDKNARGHILVSPSFYFVLIS